MIILNDTNIPDIKNLDKIPLNEINYKGYTWNQLIPLLPSTNSCEDCGIDGDEFIGMGHQNACRYLLKNQQTPAGKYWVYTKIKNAYDKLKSLGALPYYSAITLAGE